MSKFYDWERTLSYDADVTMVIGARGIGKTFGLRRQCILDFLRDGSRFCEITRYKNELSGVSDGYFNRLSELTEFASYVFRTDSRYAYIADKPEDEEKPAWKLIGYFVALSDNQRLKKRTFDHVRRLIFDEAILERSDRYHRYLTNEFGALANVVDTVSRERADTKSLRPRVYLLGNACDLSNPYFAAYGVTTDITFGYRWFADKTFLLHYVAPGDYGRQKAAGTVAGRMMRRTEAGRVAISNEFQHRDNGLVMKKPKSARFWFGVLCNGESFGVWADTTTGLFHVTSRIPEGQEAATLALTRADMTINTIAASRTSTLMRHLTDCYYMGSFRYEDERVMEGFGNVLALFGIR